MDESTLERWKDLIIDHSQFPRRHRELVGCSHEGRGDNPLCGDRVTIKMQIDASGMITDIACQSVGCAISIASASILADSIQGRGVADAESLVRKVRAMLTSADHPEEAAPDDQLEALCLVRQYPSRVKCATLAWAALHQALNGSGETVSTE